MKLTKRHLKRIIREEYSRLKRRGLIKEAVDAQMLAEIEDLCEIIQDAADDWQGYCYHYDECMINFRAEADEEADDFLYDHDLMECPESADELCSVLRDANIQSDRLFEMYFLSLYGGL